MNNVVLYKYFPCNEYTFRSLSLPGLWCHNSERMNDPFECLGFVSPEYSIDEFEVFREYAKNSKSELLSSMAHVLTRSLNSWVSENRKGWIKKYAFCALSETYDDILMWSHYANGHKGCVIGIEFDMDTTPNLHKVEYLEHAKKIDLIEFAKFVEQGDESIDSMLKHISVKASPWTYEREWRIWRNKPCYFPFRWADVKEVYFGINCEDDVKTTIVRLTSKLGNKFEYGEMEMKSDPIRVEI